MILPDVNLLLMAHVRNSALHGAARIWWEETLASAPPIGLPWAVILGFLRLSTSRAVLAEPRSVEESCAVARSWLERRNVFVIHPGERHADLLFGLLEAAGTAGNLTTDAHLAALAIEHQCELNSTDTDFARFPGLRWRNPLARPR